jgi:hypothetical protein
MRRWVAICFFHFDSAIGGSSPLESYYPAHRLVGPPPRELQASAVIFTLQLAVAFRMDIAR